MSSSANPYIWDVEYTAQFEQWWDGLTPEEQDSVDGGVRLLEEKGPNLEFPHS